MKNPYNEIDFGLPKMKFILTDSMERVERPNDVIRTMCRSMKWIIRSCVCVCVRASVFAYFMESALPFKRELCEYLQSINNICSVSFRRLLLVPLLLLLAFATLKAMCRCKFDYICATSVWRWSFRNGKYGWIVDSYGVINMILSSQLFNVTQIQNKTKNNTEIPFHLEIFWSFSVESCCWSTMKMKRVGECERFLLFCKRINKYALFFHADNFPFYFSKFCGCEGFSYSKSAYADSISTTNTEHFYIQFSFVVAVLR